MFPILCKLARFQTILQEGFQFYSVAVVGIEAWGGQVTFLGHMACK